MKKTIKLLICGLLSLTYVYGQGESNVWAFGSRAGLDFSGVNPAFFISQLAPGDGSSAAMSDASGQLLFYTNGFWVWNKDHKIMPALTGGIGGYSNVTAPTIGYPPLMPWNGGYAVQATAIAAIPSQHGNYYVFSLSTSGNLYYSMIDMSLDNGKGDIAPGQKGIYLASALAEKLTVVKGCNNIWVIVRSRTANEYKAFELNHSGLLTTPVISNCGTLPLSWYRCGTIKSSPDAKKIAAACYAANSKSGGLELYDFDTYSGVLSNPVVLDSSSTTGYYYGTCFSGDNSKLYASTSSFAYGGTFYYGTVRQFDLSLATPAAVIASNTAVFTDAVYETNKLGDLQRGRNGKLYFSSGNPVLSTLHCINNPNAAGMGCNPAANVIMMPVGSASKGMPNDIAFIAPPDTVYQVKQMTACFKDSLVITADTGKLYVWDDNSTGRSRTVYQPGTYVVSYINMNCAFETDTINVQFTNLPALHTPSYSCPGSKQGILSIVPPTADTTNFEYTWKDRAGNILRQQWSRQGDTLAGADTGTYYVQLRTLPGCDTTLETKVLPLPVPVASFTADSIVCTHTDVSFNNNSTATVWKWYFGDGNFSNEYHASYKYYKADAYRVSLVVKNIEGCSDTAFKDIEVRELKLSLYTDKDIVSRGEQVRLSAVSPQSFSVLAWEPPAYFANQSSKYQTVIMDTTRNFTVKGISEDGCESTASIKVEVKPIVIMPNAFTPNGDGLNDHFRLSNNGYIFIRHFEIYNRYGQLVYSASGANATNGWDGTFKGKSCEQGTYFYYINLETKENKTIILKGDVSLIR